MRQALIIAAASGALFQCAYLREPPRDERDMPGWVVVEDRFGGGLVVLGETERDAAHCAVMLQRRNIMASACAGSVVDGMDFIHRGSFDSEMGWQALRNFSIDGFYWRQTVDTVQKFSARLIGTKG